MLSLDLKCVTRFLPCHIKYFSISSLEVETNCSDAHDTEVRSSLSLLVNIWKGPRLFVVARNLNKLDLTHIYFCKVKTVCAYFSLSYFEHYMTVTIRTASNCLFFNYIAIFPVII